MFSQLFAVTMLGLRTIPQRLGSSLVAVVGITGVVVVLVAVLSIAEGFQRAMKATGAPDRAIVMRAGADTEMVSGFSGASADVIKQAPGILHMKGVPVASAEMFVIVDVNKKSTGTAANVPLRGVDTTALDVRPEVKIVEGRMLQFGTDEAIVGRAAR